MERSRLTLFWGLMLGLSSCLRPAAAESKYRRSHQPLINVRLCDKTKQNVAHGEIHMVDCLALGYFFFFLHFQKVVY